MIIIQAALFITLVLVLLGLLAFAGFAFYSGFHQASIKREINAAQRDFQSMGIA